MPDRQVIDNLSITCRVSQYVFCSMSTDVICAHAPIRDAPAHTRMHIAHAYICTHAFPFAVNGALGGKVLYAARPQRTIGKARAAN